MERIRKVVAKDGSLRASAVFCPKLVAEAQKIHNASPLGTVALGRSLIGALLLNSFHKESRTGLLFKGNGPLGQVFAEADFDGQARGYVENPQFDFPNEDGKIPIGKGIGKGIFTVTTVASQKELPYSGHVEIQTGEIGDDLVYYLFQSQQIPSIVIVSVIVRPPLVVTHAGGLIVQTLPNAPDGIISKLEKNIKEAKSVSEILKSSSEGNGFFAEYLRDFDLLVMDDGPELKYGCSCNIDRVTDALVMTGKKEIEILINKDEPASIQCGFCGRRYGVPVGRLKVLLKQAK